MSRSACPAPPSPETETRDGTPGGVLVIVARLPLAGLGLALFWQAGCLAVVALQGFPNVEAVVYMEGFCAIG